MRKADANISKENRENASHTANAAEAHYQQALAALDAAKLNLARTRVVSPVDGYVTNLSCSAATMRPPAPQWLSSTVTLVYGYFEETKLPVVSQLVRWFVDGDPYRRNVGDCKRLE